MITPIDRRRVLLGAVSLGGVAALAACSSSSDGSSASSSAASTSAAPEPTSASASASQSMGFGVTLAKTADVPEGGGIIVENGGQSYAVTQPSKGTFKCFSAVCPHQGCNCNAVADGKIDCPCHGSQFAISDGAVLKGPATSGLAPENIEVQGDEIKLLS